MFIDFRYFCSLLFQDLLALAARYAGGWSALLAGRQGLLETSLPKEGPVSSTAVAYHYFNDHV